MLTFTPAFTGATLIALTLLLGACGGSGGSSSTPPQTPAPADEAYNGPGSKWDATLGADGSFIFTRRANVGAPVDLTVEGSFDRLANGFLELTVAAASGTDAPQPGETAWAVEVPGYALFLKPDDSPAGNFIAMVDAGACPESDLIANWVTVKSRQDADATRPDQDFFGTFAYDAATTSASLPGRHALSDGFADLGSSDIGPVTCANGIVAVDDAEMFLTANGGALVHTNISQPDEANIIFAMPQASVTAIDELDGAYAGIVFDGSATSATVQPATVECAAGLCNGALLDGVGGAVAAQFTVNLTGTLDQPQPGFVSGTITADNETGNVACTVNSNLGGAQLVSCIGQAPGNTSAMFNLLFTG